jgi:hypothetical protein
MKKTIIFDNREYEVTENEEEVIYTDKSDEDIKFDFSFSKDPVRNKIAKDGLTIFFTEIFS